MTAFRVPVLLTRTADLDLRAVLESIARENRAYAIKLSERLAFRFRMLERNPLLGAVCCDLHGDFRCTTIDNYVLYYRIVESHVEIVRILHGSRDHGPLLEDN